MRGPQLATMRGTQLAMNPLMASEQSEYFDDDDDEDDDGPGGIEVVQESKSTKNKTGLKVAQMIAILAVFTLIFSVLLVNLPGGGIITRTANFADLSAGNRTNTAPTEHPPYQWQVSTLANLVGLDRQYKLQGTILVIVSAVCIWGSTLTSSHVTVFHPEALPGDFVEKGTLSNASQDVAQPNGRLFTVALFTAGMLNIVSMYTFWIYRSWAPWYDPIKNPLGHPTFQCRWERRLRTVWVIAPSVGFMFTAAIPSLSDTTGYKFALAMIHNILAPLSMAFCIIMETIQLDFGENAFHAFFSSEDATEVYGPLSRFQRARVVTVCFAWACGVVFLGIQVYLGLGAVLGIRVKSCYGLALVSFYGEVGGMVLVALLPALAGLGTQWEATISKGIMEQAWMLINEG